MHAIQNLGGRIARTIPTTCDDHHTPCAHFDAVLCRTSRKVANLAVRRGECESVRGFGKVEDVLYVYQRCNIIYGALPHFDDKCTLASRRFLNILRLSFEV